MINLIVVSVCFQIYFIVINRFRHILFPRPVLESPSTELPSLCLNEPECPRLRSRAPYWPRGTVTYEDTVVTRDPMSQASKELHNQYGKVVLRWREMRLMRLSRGGHVMLSIRDTETNRRF
jgi:hypothetical protein